jgi:hypothetical protein
VKVLERVETDLASRFRLSVYAYGLACFNEAALDGARCPKPPRSRRLSFPKSIRSLKGHTRERPGTLAIVPPSGRTHVMLASESVDEVNRICGARTGICAGRSAPTKPNDVN